MQTASWIIREKDGGRVIMETYNKTLVERINRVKYEAVPVQEYLASLNRPRAQEKISRETGL